MLLCVCVCDFVCVCLREPACVCLSAVLASSAAHSTRPNPEIKSTHLTLLSKLTMPSLVPLNKEQNRFISRPYAVFEVLETYVDSSHPYLNNHIL